MFFKWSDIKVFLTVSVDTSHCWKVRHPVHLLNSTTLDNDRKVKSHCNKIILLSASVTLKKQVLKFKVNLVKVGAVQEQNFSTGKM